jgi:sugar/nucleoside kinase (ribokinase family)
MNRYDIVFVGSLGTYTVVPFEGPPFSESGGPVLFGSMAASCPARRIGMVTRISEGEKQLLEQLEAAGIDVFSRPEDTPRYRIVFPTANVDERRVFLLRGGGRFVIDDMPPIAPCLLHLAGMSMGEFSLEFMEALKARGFLLSVDMQNFIFRADGETGALYPVDIPEKKEILRTADFVKLDAVEATILTGAEALQDQADILEDWGSPETIVTCSDGALVKSKGAAAFARFTNRTTRGRMGRGDTFSGAYLARRLDHSTEDSLRFAAALTSIKLESAGPFRGSVEDVIARITGPLSE